MSEIIKLNAHSELPKALSSKKLAEQVLQQLNKDLERAAIEVIPESLSPINHKSLCPLLEERIRNLLDNDYDSYMNLLYIVDVPEDAITFAIIMRDDVKISRLAADLILLREMQKVQLKSIQ